jgi:hypothetical protein
VTSTRKGLRGEPRGGNVSGLIGPGYVAPPRHELWNRAKSLLGDTGACRDQYRSHLESRPSGEASRAGDALSIVTGHVAGDDELVVPRSTVAVDTPEAKRDARNARDRVVSV